MSWDADLIDGQTAKPIQEWNYTHNTNSMINAVLRDAIQLPENEWLKLYENQCWWDSFQHPFKDNTALLDVIIAGLEADPPRFIAMNPPNKWGNYHQLLGVLKEMRTVAFEHPNSVWSVTG